MKIVAINSSYRGAQGYTQFLINKLFKGAEGQGASCETVVLSEHKINFCRSCGSCHTQGQYLKCVFHNKDDVEVIYEKMQAADLIVYATPVYLFAMSGLLKIFIDRFYSTMDISDFKLSKSGKLFHHVNCRLNSKPFVLITCFNSIEDEVAENILSYFKTYSKYMDARNVGVLTRNGARMTGHGKDPNREKKFKKISEIYKAYERAGDELATSGYIHGSTQRIANQEIIDFPFFKRLKKIKSVKRKLLFETRNDPYMKHVL